MNNGDDLLHRISLFAFFQKPGAKFSAPIQLTTLAQIFDLIASPLSF